MDFPDYTIENVTTINDKDIELHEIKFYFTRVRAEQVLALLDLLENQNINPDETRFCNFEFAEFVKALTELKKKLNIQSNTVAFVKMIGLVEEYLKRKDAGNE